MTYTTNNEKLTPEIVEKPAIQATNEAIHYVGPTSFKHNLVTGTHYRDSLPEHIQLLIEQHPKLRHLFVPSNEFAGAMSRVQEQGTLENETVKELKGELYV